MSYRESAEEAEKKRHVEREWCRERVSEWMRRGCSGAGEDEAEAGVRRVLERWKMLDEEEAEKAEIEVKRVVKEARKE